MNKIDLVKKSLDLSDQEWEDLGEQARAAILKLADPIQLEDTKIKEGRSQLAAGLRKVIDLDPREYDQIPDYAREKLLKKLDNL